MRGRSSGLGDNGRGCLGSSLGGAFEAGLKGLELSCPFREGFQK